MTSTPDLVIRGGNIADGKGGDLYEADVAITAGRITEVGKVAGKGREEIDAKGKLVAPGFVDVHTHYDGQVTWSQDITPSSQNGVTTAIMGNCGVGFAPCRPVDHVRLIQLMEGVEDIPEPVLSAGIPWAWESFPDYMDWLSKRSFDMDVGAQLPHAALRVYVMGDRGARRDPSTPEDNKAMAALAADAVRAGALGFSTSRTLNHRTSTGDYTPTLKAGEDELTAIAGRHARPGPQRVAIRARPLHHQRRPADDAAGGREHQDPGVVLDHPERQGAAALAPDARHHRRGFRARPVDHGADRRAPGRADARPGTVAQPVPDPSELSGDRPAAAGGTARAAAPAGGARRDPERARRPRPTIRCSSGRTTTRCTCSAIPRTTNSRRKTPWARRPAARASSRKSWPMTRC